MYKKNIVITRTQPSADRLARRCQQHGATTIVFPTIEIIPCDSEQLHRDLINVHHADKVIFTSTHAVNQCMHLFKQYALPIPHDIAYFAIGPSTAQRLQSQWPCQVQYPAQPYTSEALLAMPPMQQVNAQTIVIIAGVAGRDLLQQTLQVRGAKVKKLNIYQRICAKNDPEPLLNAWQYDKIDAIITTSVEGLKNLFTIVGEQGKPYLLQTPLLVVSERMRQHALGLGYATNAIIQAASAQDEDIMSAL